MTQAHALPIQVNLYDRLFTVAEPDKIKDQDPSEHINPNSLEVSNGFIEPSVLDAQPGARYQFQRMGYFILDRKKDKDQLIFNKTVGLRDTWKNG